MIRIGSIVLRVDDLQRQTEFWEAALGYVRRDSGESVDFVLLARPTAPGRICAKNMERLWSLAGATSGNRWQMNRPRKRMVRRGSTVRVRQRALQKPRKTGLLRSGALARPTTSGRYGARYGAFRSRIWRPGRADTG